MTSLDTRRDDYATRFRRHARAIVEEHGVNRPALDRILAELKELAAERALWREGDFPPPDPDEQQARYLIGMDEDSTFALYLNVMRPGKRVLPHNHTTWACIAAVEGEECNRLYRRLDDGTVPGRATIELADEINVGPGSGVALMPDDIHSVTIEGDAPIRHLHMYGRALETLTERVLFDPGAGTCRIMDIGVKTRVKDRNG
jgi:predicted metal-dependent enzyme (double-stranded beta helix superfamily)